MGNICEDYRATTREYKNILLKHRKQYAMMWNERLEFYKLVSQ
jgi:hypothetical protein